MYQRPLVIAVVVVAILLTNVWAGSSRGSQIADMNVLVDVPDTPPRLAGKLALMVNLHGCGQKNRALQQRGNWIDTADEYGMVVALPNVSDNGVILGCWDYYGEGTRVSWPVPLPPR
jgi:poly(3-hydroxybutyrate) depolymerase